MISLTAPTRVKILSSMPVCVLDVCTVAVWLKCVGVACWFQVGRIDFRLLLVINRYLLCTALTNWVEYW
jgi:hypothetical protein